MHPFFILFGTMWLRFLFLIGLLISVSAKADMANDVAWLKLLHYEKSGSSFVSLVENDDFFISKNGRYDHRLEFEQTVEQFNKVDDVRKCSFPARFIYLKNKGLVEGSLDACDEYQKFLADVQPKSVTMLFTNAYMSNPSSLFGHTLFRIDTKRKGTQLLAHGANFGADTGDEDGVLYVLKGLWGGYFGTFGIRPYYDVINLYNNIENRDIWEYELDFSDDELELFVAHVWEMKNAKIRYYFATKNCSYVLLLMLEAIKPELDLSSGFGFYVAPLDTLKRVDDVSGFIKSANYRPSRQSKLNYRAEQMNKNQYKAFIDIIKKDKVDLSKLSDDEKSDVLETAYQYVQYRYVDGAMELKDYRKKSFKLLQERSKIANNKQFFEELKEGENPILAHQAGQVSLGLGFRNGDAFQEIGFKPLYNTLMDNSYGLLKGAEINFLDAKVRHYDRDDKYVLNELNLIGIRSLSKANDMFSPFSYDIKVGYKELFDATKDDDSGAFVLDLGVGQSYSVSKNMMLYVMSVPNAVYGGGLHNNGYLGFGFKSGFYYNNGDIRFLAEAKQNFTTDDTARGQTYMLEGAYGLSKNTMMYAKYQMFNSSLYDDEEMVFGLRFNF